MPLRPWQIGGDGATTAGILTTLARQFNAKQARREAQKAVKQDNELKKQIQAVRQPSPRFASPPSATRHGGDFLTFTFVDAQLLKKGETQQAAQKARMLLAKQAIAAQMDQAADMAELSVAQIQANNAMNRMTAMMAQSSRTMNRAQQNVNPEKVRRPLPFYLLTWQEISFATSSINLRHSLSPDSCYPRAVQNAERRVRHVKQHISGCHDAEYVGAGLG